MKLGPTKLASLEDIQDESSKDKSVIKKTKYKAKPLTPEEEIGIQRGYGISLMRSSAFLLNDYLKTFKSDDYNRFCVQDTIKNLVKQVQFEWVQRCKKPTFKDIPEYGDKMTIKEWLDCVACGGFIDYDGDGDLATDKFISNISIKPSDITFFKVELPMWATHVVWYNK